MQVLAGHARSVIRVETGKFWRVCRFVTVIGYRMNRPLPEQFRFAAERIPAQRTRISGFVLSGTVATGGFRGISPAMNRI
jgi:hypothetical protein